MNKWTCRTCDWILEVPSQGVRPEICPLCANDPERAQPNPGHHRWLSGPDAAEILIKG
jgi:hypothetical protein